MDNFSASSVQQGFKTVEQGGVLVEMVHLALPHILPTSHDASTLSAPTSALVTVTAASTEASTAASASASANTVQALSDLCLLIHAGDKIALTGSSGSGKSVLLRTLALLERPVRGEVRFAGVTVRPSDVPSYRRAIAYVPQRPSLPGETVRDAFQQPFTLSVRRDQDYDEAKAVAWLTRAGKPASFLDKSNATLSGGESQVAALVRTVLLDPQLLLLDEPTAALDPESAAAIEALVSDWSSQSARAYLWISHDPEQAARIGQCRWHIDAGRIVIDRRVDL